jgi:hypothetical protein
MPYFYEYVDVNINVYVDEFLDKCDRDEIKEVIEWLRDSEYITDDDLLDDDSPQSAMEELFVEDVAKIRRLYLTLSKEDFNTIIQIAKKY